MTVSVLSGGILNFARDLVDNISGSGKRLRRYDPREVHLIWGGFPVHPGAVNGTFITVEHVEPRWKLVKGTDGEGARVRTNNFSGRVQLTIRSGSKVNDALSLSSAADDLTGLIAVPLFLNDTNGTSLYTSPLSFLESPANNSFGVEEGSVTWTFICNTLLSFTGGLEKAV